MKKKKLKLRPWVKVSMMFIFGVVVVSNIFSIFNADASTKEPKNKVLHGVVVMNLNGDSHLNTLEEFTEDDLVIKGKNYATMEIVTVILQDGKVINSYLTKGKELKEIENKFDYSIVEIRRNALDSLYE